jgi:Leucine-rich repeat (LRR) protein
MKNLFSIFTACMLFLNAATAQIVNIPDANFKNALVNDTCAYLGTSTIKTDVDTNNDGEIQTSEAAAVTYLSVSYKQIASLVGIQSFTSLQKLNCNNNPLSSLNVQGLTSLKTLVCDNNLLQNLNVQGLTNLEFLNCGDNPLVSLNIQGLTNLQTLYCVSNGLVSLNVQGLANLEFLNCSANSLVSLNIQGLTNLQTLFCGSNRLTELNVQGLMSLQFLYLQANQLTSFSAQGLTSLKNLACDDNLLQNLNVQGLTNLEYLHCKNNFLVSLNTQDLTSLLYLDCHNNQLTSINLQGLTNLNNLQCYNNQLSSLNLQGLTNLNNLQCFNNQLSSLNLEGLINFRVLMCDNNQLTSLFIKNASDEVFLSFSNNPNLTYICCDDTQLTTVQSQATQYGYTNCAVNSYCSFTPGGTFYTIQGNSKLDTNNNGCDANDAMLPNMKFNITNDTINGSAIANASGNYSISVEAGTHTLTPVLENPTYYTISPTTTQITFPTAASPFTQNFCITPNGTHHDVEATLIPTTSARPGFDANYKIIFKNKGNQTANGVVSFGFDDAKMDMVSTSIAPSTTAIGARTWNYTLLKPFETRTIDLVLNINGPMETPAVNGGDVLPFTANITLGANDEMPSDNAAVLNQTVTNAFDPNDKTCSEGRQILLSKVGDFLHYTIRFENTGTANATNIVVKDMIDLAKYDIASLQMLKASHDCRVRILNENQVEFIFENINLPFTAPNKYGYVTFKIKTKSTLVVGDIATNKADIFFDYNFPIITNTASTQVVTSLNPSEGGKPNSIVFDIAPNPVSDILTFKTDATIEKCEIYDNLGRIVQKVGEVATSPTLENQINVAHLPKGIYFVKVYAKDSSAVRKMVKN